MQKGSKNGKALIKDNLKWSLWIICMVVLPSVILLAACSRTPDGIITVETEPIVITESGVLTGGTVYYSGNFTIGTCGVCYSESSYPTINDEHTEDSYGSGWFFSTLNNLKSGTKYYVRAYAKTSSGIIYGDQRDFDTENKLYYGNNTYESAWGLTAGGNDEWAVMFPSYMLSSNYGKYISTVKVYFNKTGVYTLTIYQGGDTEPTTSLMSRAYNITNTGWVTINNFTPLSLNTSKNLWVSISYSYEAGTYPKCASSGINEPNARWSHNKDTDEWYDTYYNNQNRDLCWLIQVLLSDNAKGGGNEIELSYSEPTSISNDEVVSHKKGNTNIQHSCAK